MKIIWFGTPLVIFPFYAWFSGSYIFKFKIKDKNELTFSADGIQHGCYIFFAKNISAIVIYIYSFDCGDKNIISFRSKGKVMDFTFYLKDHAQLCVLREVINDWKLQGINVLVKQKSNNDFVTEKTNNYNQQPASEFF